MQIALIGTRGVPARYGGFETCVEEVGRRLVAAGHQVRVYCRPSGVSRARRRAAAGVPGDAADPSARGAQAVLETLAHTALSVLHRTLAGADAAIVFNAANAPLLPVLKARRHPGRHPRRRAGMAPRQVGSDRAALLPGRRVARRALVGSADRRRPGHRRLLHRRVRRRHRADRLRCADPDRSGFGQIAEFGVHPGRVSPGGGAVRTGEPRPRDRPGYRPQRRRTAAAGGRGRSVRRRLHRLASAPPPTSRVRLLGRPVGLRTRSTSCTRTRSTYWHGHSVGGTNPSLLRAAGAATCTCAYDVIFNREVLGAWGQFFTTPDDVAELIMKAEADPRVSGERGQRAAGQHPALQLGRRGRTVRGAVPAARRPRLPAAPPVGPAYRSLVRALSVAKSAGVDDHAVR